MPSFRTAQEILRANWAEKYMSVAEGKLYTPENSPFPIHEYFKLGLLGKNIKMLEVNAGHALVENMVADTLTDMKIQVGDEGEDGAEQEIREWFEEIDFEAKLEEAVRSFYGVGYGVEQLYRLEAGKENAFTIATLDPSTWYPDDPGLLHLNVTSGRVVSVFCEVENGSRQWYALEEKHRIGKVEYKLYKLEKADATEGKEVPLSTLSRFGSLEDAATDLDALPIMQIDRVKPSGYIFGTSVLQPIWGILQEVSEIQTQIRQERIKHFRSRLAVPRQALMPVEPDKDTEPQTSKARAAAQNEAGLFNLNQEIFPIPPQGNMPAYIQWDMQMIEKGSNEIDKLLSRAAAIVGAPRSVFNLDDKGDIHVETDRRKNQRYIRKIMQGQRRAGQLVKRMIELWYQWKGEKLEQAVTVSFASPFDLTQEEKVKLMKEMNPDATLVSQKKAIREVWPTMKPGDRETLEKEIEDERQMNEPPPSSMLNRVPTVEL